MSSNEKACSYGRDDKHASAILPGHRILIRNTESSFVSAQILNPSCWCREVVAHVSGAFPKALLLSIGWSLGANIMLRYLGEVGSSSPIHAAASLCNPFTLTISNANMKKGFNRCKLSRYVLPCRE